MFIISLTHFRNFAPTATSIFKYQAKYFPQIAPLEGSKKTRTLFTHCPSVGAMCKRWAN
jgi:hypothetical protein